MFTTVDGHNIIAMNMNKSELQKQILKFLTKLFETDIELYHF